MKKKWTPDEDKLFGSGMTNRQIAEQIGRSIVAVTSRRTALNRPADMVERRREYIRAYYADNKEIRREYVLAYRAANKERDYERGRAYRATNREAILERKRAYRAANRELINERRRASCAANRESRLEEKRAHHAANRESRLEEKRARQLEYGRAYRAANRERLSGLEAENWRERYRTDPVFACYERIRCSMAKHLRRRSIRASITFADLGYTPKDLREHIERQFTDEMNWDKFLAGKIHIDHRIPVAAFPLGEDVEMWRICYGLENLQPLWGKDNDAKRVTHDRAIIALSKECGIEKVLLTRPSAAVGRKLDFSDNFRFQISPILP